MKYAFHPEALDELIAAGSWYEQQQAGLGLRFLNNAQAAIQNAADDPLLCSRLETYTGDREVRRCPVGPFSYVMIFESVGESLLVLAIAHMSRRPNYWLPRIN